MNPWQKCVSEFHRVMGYKVRDKGSEGISLRNPRFRVRLIAEEVDELNHAIGKGDLFGSIDAIVDIIYVCIGSAEEWGFDLEPFFDEVHRANMRKVGGPVAPDGKFLKPEGWVGPDHGEAMNRHMEMYPALDGPARPVSNADIIDDAQSKVEICAHAAHAANKAYCEAIGDNSQHPWENSPGWQVDSAIEGVIGVLRGDDPEDSHVLWLRVKEDDGWVYGPVKDPEKKIHPCMVPYEKLRPEHRKKDDVFVSTVRSMARSVGLMDENGCLTQIGQIAAFVAIN